MNEQLEKLIDLALVDGILTDKERQVLQRKAQELGVDQDEFEMVLESKLYLAQKAAAPPPPSQSVTTPQKPKSNKHGDLRKCPACGANTNSFSTRCQDCGTDFKNVDPDSSISRLYNTLQEIEIKARNAPKPKSLASLIGDNRDFENSIGFSQAQAISSFPVPNTKESILEFLSNAVPQAKVKFIKVFGIFPVYEDKGKIAITNAWKTKCEQVIIKARFAMKDDKKTLEEVENYAKQLKIK